MPYCPKCGGEYREGFKECSDCLLELVDTPPKTPRPPGLDDEGVKTEKKEGKKPSAINNTASCTSCRPQVNLAMVFKAQNDMEALEIKSMLAGSNISAVVAESGWASSGSIEVPVFVDENDAADARELIRTSYGKAVEDGEDETVIYELEEGEDLLVEEDEEEYEDEEEEEDDVVEEQYASTMEGKSEELRRRMEGTDSNRGLLLVLIVVVIIVLIVLYLHYG